MSEHLVVRGIGASVGKRRGRARVLLNAGDFSRLRAGDILVTRFTTPEVVLVFDRIAGLVTDQGGRSAHAAVVAREIGVPAVVGTQWATEAIVDGSVIALDGTEGSVRVIEPESD